MQERYLIFYDVITNTIADSQYQLEVLLASKLWGSSIVVVLKLMSSSFAVKEGKSITFTEV
jgi:hypothetical protein